MSATLWILTIINFFICGWNSYASGLLWGASKPKQRWQRVVAGAGITIGFVGMMYVGVLVGVLLGYLPETYLISANVFLGAPLIAAGIIVTIHSWQQALRHGGFWNWAITIWNTLSTFWNIYVWIESAKALSDIGIMNSLSFDSDDAKSAGMLYLFIAAIIVVFISVGLFKYGKKQGELLLRETGGFSF